MRYAVLSDIHANLEAFEAVLDDASRRSVDGYISLGDVVGYGTDSSACLKLLKSLDPAILIAGNHEWGALGLRGMEYFNPHAAAAVAWTARQLGDEETEFIRSFTLKADTGTFEAAHGSLERPEDFNYIMAESDALGQIRLLKTKLLFVGHSHVAFVYTSGGKRIVNAGSIGQPRDGDPRAAYVIYDDESGDTDLFRIAYDIEKAASKIRRAGLPEVLASRLYKGY